MQIKAITMTTITATLLGTMMCLASTPSLQLTLTEQVRQEWEKLYKQQKKQWELLEEKYKQLDKMQSQQLPHMQRNKENDCILLRLQQLQQWYWLLKKNEPLKVKQPYLEFAESILVLMTGPPIKEIPEQFYLPEK